MISALMITGKSAHHRKLAAQAVRCFKEQTYEGEKQLVIINTAFDAPWFTNRDPEIKEVCISPRPLGLLRNLSYEYAEGDLWMQWDDDDWHHPDRMKFQVNNYVPDCLNLLESQLRVDLTTWDVGVVSGQQISKVTTGIVGTMLHPALPKPLQYPFKYLALSRGEDSKFLRSWIAQPKAVAVHINDPKLYVRLYHGGNTWDREHVMRPALKRPYHDDDLIPRLRTIYHGMALRDSRA